MTQTWDDVRDRLEARLRALADRDTVVLSEPQRQGAPTGLLRRSKPLPCRYVQAVRIGDSLSGECVGATLFGGDWEVTPGQHEQLRALGWQAPADLVDTEPGYPNYRVDVGVAEADRLARLQVEALAVLGAQPDDVDFELPGRP